jgi:Leucine-rich repeat (LRR) protein
MALFDLYTSTEGSSWLWFNGTGVDNGVPWNFTGHADPCTDMWQGVSCSAQNFTGGDRHVITLQLAGHNLRGTIPNTIMNLSRLEVLYLNDNSINGIIPAAIGQYMPDLRYLDLSYNYLTSSIPRSFCDTTHMRNVDLYSNLFTGTIPDCLGSLMDLRGLDANTNQLTGTIPAALSGLERLEYLALYTNSLSGNLHSCLGNYSRMTEFSLSNNLLTGSVPDIIGTYKDLYYVQLDHNLLTGTLSGALFDLPELLQFSVSENRLHGTLPNQMSQAAALTQIFMFGNTFTGQIPSSLGGLQHLTEVSLDFNALTGPIPHAVGAIKRLQYFYVQNNLLSGSVPSSFSNLSAIQEVYLQSNRLSGSLHRVFNSTVQTALTIVQLSDNQLTGTLPEEPFLLPLLNTFVSVSNCFTGTLPEVICNNSQLVSLILDGLHSASSCRTEILPALSKAYYAAEGFHGTVPACMFHMRNLSTLHISGNGLTGPLPADTDISPRLIDLTISHNDLTGNIPVAFQQRMWKNLDLSYNRLAGQLRSDFATRQFDFSFNLVHTKVNITASASSLSIQNNRLSGAVPHSIVYVANISVLGSNLFSCKLDKSDLPVHDSQRLNYNCGSDSFSIPYYLWLVLLGLAMAGAGLIVRYPSWLERSPCCKNALVSLRQWSVPADGLPRNFRYVAAMSDILCQMSVRYTTLIVVVLVPWYSVASHYFGTYTHQYGWVVSAAFLSGNAATAVEFCVMVIIMLGVVLSVTHLTTKYDREVHFQPDRFDSRSVDGRFLYSKDRRTTVPQRLAIYAAYAAVNLAVVVGVNVLFVYIALYQSNSLLILAQVMLSFFKLGWNSVCTPYLIRQIAEYLSDTTSGAGFVSIQVMVALFNNIAIPCLVVAVVSPSCFYNVFDAPPSVDSRFVYYSCADFLDTGCDFYSPEIISTTYNPPFLYDYQCSSGMLTYYAPAFIYLAVAAGFVTPALKVAVQRLHQHATPGSYWFDVVDTVLPRIFKPLPAVYLSDGQEVSIVTVPRETAAAMSMAPPEEVRRNILKPYFDANMLIITLMTYLGILLTFGVVFPPLAVAMCVTMLSVAWQGKLAVGRFLHNARELNALKFVDVIEQECKGAVTIHKIRRCIFMVVCFCSCFYALFLFDTLGDAVGPGKALWVLVAMPTLPLLLYIAHQFRRHVLVQQRPLQMQEAYIEADDAQSIEMRPSSHHTTPAALNGATCNPLVDSAATLANSGGKEGP